MQTSTARRWTPSQIRKALPFPKPRRPLPRDQEPASAEIALLRHLAEHADMLSVPNALDYVAPWGQTAGWLLVPAPAWVLSVLAQIGASEADLEPEPLEDGGDAEPEGDEVDGDENEAGHVRPESASRSGLTDDAPSTATPEQRDRYRSGEGWRELARVRRMLPAYRE